MTPNILSLAVKRVLKYYLSRKLFILLGLFGYMAIGALGIILFVIGSIMIIVWFINAFSNIKYKIFAVLLIAIILFTYISFSVTIRDENLDLTTVSGFVTANKLYFSWLVNVFKNFKTVTVQAIKLDWGATNSSVK